MSGASGSTGTNRVSPAEAFAAAARAQRAGDWNAAATSYRQALALKPDLVEAHHNLGLVLRALAEFDEAKASFRRALDIRPAMVDSQISLGLVFQDEGQTDAAKACFEQALILRPGHPGARMNLGILEHLRGNFDLSIEIYRDILREYPNVPDVHLNLGAVLKDQGDLAGATDSLRRALSMRPDYAAAHHHLGGVLEAQGRLGEAVQSYERAIDLRPDLVEAHTNLANLLSGQGRLTAAEAVYRRAIALRPSAPEAHMNLAKALQSQGRLADAMAAFEAVLALQPDHSAARDAWLCGLNYRSDIPPPVLLAEHCRRAPLCQAPPAEFHPNAREPARRLRIGYVSGDFHHHPVGFFMEPILTAHDLAQVEVFCYSNDDQIDAVSARLRAAADHWRDIAGLSDALAAARIREDEIDILVDLSGRTPSNRLSLFAARPAPIQASWLGYAATTGLADMDYLVMDPVSAPDAAETWCREALVRLPYGRFCYAPPADAPKPNPPPSLTRNGVVFGGFNNLIKIGPEVAALWASVIAATPGSRLVLKWAALVDEGVQARVRALFASAGLPMEALELRGFSPHVEMLAEYGDIDIALDPFPFCGGLTSCEALWMGVPVVTMPSDRFASRQTASFLETLGLGDLIAATPEDFVSITAGLAADVARRGDLRATLRARMKASPLCDSAAFTPTLEIAYREMWRRYCGGDIATPLDVRSPFE
jgi:predicted O-linked N-acetylglucosamine transferase (SPINDLY family)